MKKPVQSKAGERRHTRQPRLGAGRPCANVEILYDSRARTLLDVSSEIHTMMRQLHRLASVCVPVGSSADSSGHRELRRHLQKAARDLGRMEKLARHLLAQAG